ncbi:MAG: (2Fe-2S)-binding protein, partial [Oscillospiraceae bacterium]|nr:(2Fe-2S)-binding protein [Oscillospiraceae bacterium]
MSTITINGKTINTSENVTILDAAKANGINIPRLCYMEGVSDLGMCRICVVEVEGYKNFLPACRTKALDGMVITTESETLDAYRREMLELILSNHHLDCMSCPANGTCELQNLCNRYGVKNTAYTGSRKEIEKEIPVAADNPFITYDPGKCIHCQRCINVCHTIACNGTLRVGRRGTFHMVDAPFGKGYKVSGCESCGNCASVCPTGALTLKKEESYRNWEVTKTLTTCPHCATGCQFYLVVKDNKIVNVEPANGPSNHHRLCVKGRSGSFDFVHS